MYYALIIASVIILLSAISLLIAYIIYRMAFHWTPDPGADIYQIPDNEQYKNNQSSLFSMIKELDSLTYEPVEIVSHDGLKLFARYYHVTDNAPVHIEFHGYRSTAIRDFCGGDRIVRSLKHNTLLVDQRAHGRSEGHAISFGINERHDCLSWINYVIGRFGKDTKIFLIGVSMGAATVLMATGLDLPYNVKGVIADCPYSSPWAIISKVAKGMRIPTKLAYPFAKLGARLFGGFDLTEASAVEAVKTAKVPILLVHGEEDHFVPCDMSREITASCASDITFVTVPQAGHALSYIIDEAAYTNAAVNFINKCLN